MSLEFVNDHDTKDLLSAIEQYARARGLERVVLTYNGELRGTANTWEEPASGDASQCGDRRFRLEASHWFEESP